MEFEFDPTKSEANRQKHGIDFSGAMSLWDDENRIEIPARTTDEPRFVIVGKIADKHWSAVITYRGKTRVVSVRRSRQEEVKLYEGQGE